MQLAELTVRGFADLLGSDAPAPGGFLEMRIAQNAQLKDILHIDIHNLIKPIHRKVFGAAFVRNAGIVDQKIQYTVVWRGDFLQ